MTSEVFAKRFNDEMKTKGDNIYSVAMKHGVSVALVAGCAYQGKLPPVRKLVKLCSSYGLSIDYLIGDCDENKPVNSGVVYDYASDYPKQLAKRAKSVIRNSVSEASQKTGIKYTDIAAFVASGKAMKIENVLSFAKYYNVSLDWLLGLSEEG